MSQHLPYSGFKWLNQNEISDFCLNSISENSSISYILEIHLDYPSKLFRLSNDYPLAPEKKLKVFRIYCQNIVLMLKMNME